MILETTVNSFEEYAELKFDFDLILGSNQIDFSVYPVYSATDIDGNKSIMYLDKTSSDIHSEFNKENCRLWFSGGLRWSGCWDDWIHFEEDGEYYADEVNAINDILKQSLEALKEEIRNKYKEYDIREQERKDKIRGG